VVDLIEEAGRLQQFLSAQGWKFCFIGGLAVQHWGEPRLTRDLDLALLTGFGGEAGFLDRLLEAYAPRISQAREFALSRRVLLLKSQSGIGIDVSLAALPFEEAAIGRSVVVEMSPGVRLRLCAPEDLIVMKLFAGRETDLRDTRSVVVRQGADSLDWVQIEASLSALAEVAETPDLLDRLAQLRARPSSTPRAHELE